LTVTQKVSTTSVSCKPKSGSAAKQTSITCTAKVKGYLPTGTVTWTQAGTGSVTLPTTPSCTLTQSGKSTTTASCSVIVTVSSAGSVTLTASYSGDSNNQVSQQTAKLTIKS
jgi:hypothetical protein